MGVTLQYRVAGFFNGPLCSSIQSASWQKKSRGSGAHWEVESGEGVVPPLQRKFLEFTS